MFYRDVNTVYVYLATQLVATAPLSNTGFKSLTPAGINTTLVGGSGNGTYSCYGQIDDLGMWTRPLSEAEINGIYQAGGNCQGIPVAKTGAPNLSAALAGNTVAITYPAWAAGYTLRSSPTLAAGSWTSVASTPVIVGSEATVNLALSRTNAFFRLRN